MNDEQAVQAIYRGDARAMAALMDKYSHLLWSVARAVLADAGSDADIEECVADCFIELWRYPEKYDPMRGKLKTYLCMLARFRAIDRARAIARRRETPFHMPGALVGFLLPDPADLSLQGERLRLALEALDESDREMLFRRFVQAQKPRDIALAMDIPVRRVENRLYRAKQKLRQILTKE